MLRDALLRAPGLPVLTGVAEERKTIKLPCAGLSHVVSGHRDRIASHRIAGSCCYSKVLRFCILIFPGFPTSSVTRYEKGIVSRWHGGALKTRITDS